MQPRHRTFRSHPHFLNSSSQSIPPPYSPGATGTGFLFLPLELHINCYIAHPLFCLAFKDGFVELYFTYHTMHAVNMYNSVFFSIFIDMYMGLLSLNTMYLRLIHVITCHTSLFSSVFCLNRNLHVSCVHCLDEQEPWIRKNSVHAPIAHRSPYSGAIVFAASVRWGLTRGLSGHCHITKGLWLVTLCHTCMLI